MAEAVAATPMVGVVRVLGATCVCSVSIDERPQQIVGHPPKPAKFGENGEVGVEY